MPPNQDANKMPTSFGGNADTPAPVTSTAAGQTATVSDEFSKESKGGPGGKKMLIIGLIVLAIILGGVFTMTRRPGGATANTGGGAGPTGTSGTARTIPTIDPSLPSLTFQAAAGTSHAANEEFTIQIKANSQGADINGYDLLFPYDKNAFEILEVKSLSPSFQIYQFDRVDYYSVTGIKLLNVKDPTPFTEAQPILEMKLKGKQKGKLYIDVLKSKGKETSKFVDKDIKIIEPQLQPIELEIQ